MDNIKYMEMIQVKMEENQEKMMKVKMLRMEIALLQEY